MPYGDPTRDQEVSTVVRSPTCFKLIFGDHRQREVLLLLAIGKINAQIGEFLKTSIKTVKTHRRRLISKLGLKTVAELK